MPAESRLILQVHDEVILEVVAEERDEVAGLTRATLPAPATCGSRSRSTSRSARPGPTPKGWACRGGQAGPSDRLQNHAELVPGRSARRGGGGGAHLDRRGGELSRPRSASVAHGGGGPATSGRRRAAAPHRRCGAVIPVASRPTRSSTVEGQCSPSPSLVGPPAGSPWCSRLWTSPTLRAGRPPPLVQGEGRPAASRGARGRPRRRRGEHLVRGHRLAPPPGPGVRCRSASRSITSPSASPNRVVRRPSLDAHAPRRPSRGISRMHRGPRGRAASHRRPGRCTRRRKALPCGICRYLAFRPSSCPASARRGGPA